VASLSLMTFVTAAVAETCALSGRFRRVVLRVPDLGDLQLPRGADTSIGVYFGESGAAPGRTYTVRHCDPARRCLTVDVLLHGEGIGTGWAQQAAAGDVVTIGHPGSWYTPRSAATRQLLVADLAGFPALARVLQALPSKPDATAVVEVRDESELDYLPQHPDVEVICSVGTGNGVGHSVVSHLATDRLAAGGWDYCWFAGEATAARAVKNFLRRELHWPFDRFDVMGYWRADADDWGRRYAAIGPSLFAAYQRALAAGKDERLAAEEFDLALERAGL
jgi:NADPH-dependent ferric siderophore reductase